MNASRALGIAVAAAMAAGVLPSAAALAAEVGPDAAAAASNMEIVGHSDLNGVGKTGEGMALKQYADGRRILFLAHESGPMCVSVLDVTQPTAPKVVTQVPAEEADLRCNSLALADNNVLVVAREAFKTNEKYVGIYLYDVSDPSKPKQLSYFDTTGPSSNGTHFVSVTGHYAYLTTGAADFEPKLPATRPYPHNDNAVMMIVDIADARHPKEVGRLAYPGVEKGDTREAPHRIPIAIQDMGFRPHGIIVLPGHEGRAYVAWIDGGVSVVDISDKAHPKFVSIRSFQSAAKGFAHTFLPLLDRGIAVSIEESNQPRCKDWPKRIWTWDISDETNPFPMAVVAPPENLKALCAAGGRFGAHNINMNHPYANERRLKNTVVSTFFNGGVRVYSIADPYRPLEIGFIIPKAPPGNVSKTIQMNDVLVDENGLIYAGDRLTGGLYVIKYTGKVPLD